MTANVGLAPVVAVLLVASAGVSLNPVDARAEANCLTAPGAQAPPGRHWFYRIDRPQQRKCWYLRAQGAAEATAKVPPKPTRAHCVRRPGSKIVSRFRSARASNQA